MIDDRPCSFGMVLFQTFRRAELERWAQGDRTAEPPARGAPPDGRNARTLAQVWHLPPAPKPPYAGAP